VEANIVEGKLFPILIVGSAFSARFAHSRGKQVSRESKCLAEKMSERENTAKNALFHCAFKTIDLNSAFLNMANSPELESTSSNYYYFPHVTKRDYDQAFNTARLWALKHPEEPSTTAARIYHIKELALRKSVCRLRTKQRNDQGAYNA
jgi:hypothetical protein